MRLPLLRLVCRLRAERGIVGLDAGVVIGGVVLASAFVGGVVVTSGLSASSRLSAAVQSAIDDANKAVSHAEAIKAFRILPEDWTVESDHLTPSMKVKRNVVLKDYAAEVESLYSGKSG